MMKMEHYLLLHSQKTHKLFHPDFSYFNFSEFVKALKINSKNLTMTARLEQ